MKLLELGEPEYFTREYKKIKERQTILEHVNNAESHRMAIISTNGKKGAQAYTKWRRDKIDMMLDSPEEKPPENLFSKLKSKKVKETLFTKLKGARK